MANRNVYFAQLHINGIVHVEVLHAQCPCTDTKTSTLSSLLEGCRGCIIPIFRDIITNVQWGKIVYSFLSSNKICKCVYKKIKNFGTSNWSFWQFCKMWMNKIYLLAQEMQFIDWKLSCWPLARSHSHKSFTSWSCMYILVCCNLWDPILCLLSYFLAAQLLFSPWRVCIELLCPSNS